MVRFRIGTKEIASGNPCFIIAEAGVNHNGRLDLALELVDAAAKAGADAVKFQTFKADKLIMKGTPQAEYQKKNALSKDQYAMLRALELSEKQFAKICSRCSEKGIVFLSTPFDEESVDLLERLGIPAYKVGSGDLDNLPLLGKIALLKKPLILSTGMSAEREIRRTVSFLEEAGVNGLALLHCVSAYPAPCEEVNLRAMSRMMKDYRYPVGYSDHTVGNSVAIAAVVLGATVIEKHFTLDRRLEGPDHRASSTPAELARMVKQIRQVESALGDGIKRIMPSEVNTREVARKSIVSSRLIRKGERVHGSMLTAKRPPGGIAPADEAKLIGMRARSEIKAGTLLKWEMFE